jgi:hypothetical protein
MLGSFGNFHLTADYADIADTEALNCLAERMGSFRKKLEGRALRVLIVSAQKRVTHAKAPRRKATEPSHVAI